MTVLKKGITGATNYYEVCTVKFWQADYASASLTMNFALQLQVRMMSPGEFEQVNPLPNAHAM